MTFQDLYDKWAVHISDWAIRKGWMQAVNDPEHGITILKARSAAELIGLAMTEIRELEQGIAAADAANIREEAAGFAVRLLQLLVELDLKPPYLVPPFVESGLHGRRDADADPACLAAYRCCLDSMENARRNDTKIHTAPGLVQTCFNVSMLAREITDPQLRHSTTVWDWLDGCIDTEMKKNEGREHRHGGKLC